MNEELKNKLDAVKAYLGGLPDKFKKLQDQIDALKADDQADADKIAALTTEVDTLKADHDGVIATVDELVAAKDAADTADGPE